VFLYATNWLGGGAPPDLTSISLEDIHGLMEVSRDVDGPGLDVVLHSPGGQAEATASIVRYLRSRFEDIRVFVPLAAMSAATMWALAANRIVMGKHSPALSSSAGRLAVSSSATR
jgi:ClpP class serine protease